MGRSGREERRGSLLLWALFFTDNKQANAATFRRDGAVSPFNRITLDAWCVVRHHHRCRNTKKLCRRSYCLSMVAAAMTNHPILQCGRIQTAQRIDCTPEFEASRLLQSLAFEEYTLWMPVPPTRVRQHPDGLSPLHHPRCDPPPTMPPTRSIRHPTSAPPDPPPLHHHPQCNTTEKSVKRTQGRTQARYRIHSPRRQY